MSELKQLKQLSQLDAEQVGGGEGDCPVTASLSVPGIASVSNTGTAVDQTVASTITGAITGTYEGIIQATSYALERVINAVTD